MSAFIEPWVNQIICVITNDGRSYIGILKSFDNLVNIVLEQSHERIYSLDSPVEVIDRGLIFIRGDNINCLGPIDEDKDLAIDFETARGHPLNVLRH